jgi:hypothetical protein
MERDRDTQRVWATVHRITRKRIELYANAEDLSVGGASARLVRAGFEQHAFIDSERESWPHDEFAKHYLLPPAPPEGEGVRVKIPLTDDEIERVKELAINEFEIEPTILNRLLLWGFRKVPRSPNYWRAWMAYTPAS